MPRFQECPWYVRLWRRVRHQWNLPYEAVRFWWLDRRRGPHPVTNIQTGEDVLIMPMTLKQSWGLALGLSHCAMDYTYTWEEVQKMMEKNKAP